MTARATTPTPSRRTAVVVGASMAGLSAAAVLASRFESVVLVERDEVTGEPRDRKGVPQGRHAHGLLPAGLQRLEGWFPGLTDELVADGAHYLDLGNDALWYQGGYRRRFPTGFSGPLASRALLEHHVRRRALALANVSLRSGAGVTGLTATADNRQVTGVVLDDGTTLAADLVVDTSGRAGRSLRWLEELGYAAPPTSEVKVDVAYSSRVVRWDGPRDWAFALVLAGPPTGRQGVAFPLEGDRWIVTLAGMHGDRPPTDDAGMLAFARSLPSPEIAQVLETCTPLADVVTHRLPSNQRRHLDRLRRAPGGLVLLGDSVCSFNPTYGQGMSTAALQAEALGRALDRSSGLDGRFVKAFYKRAAKAINPAWMLTTGADFALPATTGPKPPGTDLLNNRYMPRVFLATQVSDDVCRRFIEVSALLKPPPALLTPAMIVKVLVASRRARRTVAPVPAPTAQPTTAAAA
ncbi:MAG TPA: FAD-dependent monooxygenase [Acidimicrobiales bacterium]|jgi:2-polyprenyl-6-methoxyphenol hydroxylase-like FAD-dependent oxidoreductase|nr:FAD-dependent monooxygenase [Acidimicrobiales bacterium]